MSVLSQQIDEESEVLLGLLVEARETSDVDAVEAVIRVIEALVAASDQLIGELEKMT